MTRNIIVTGSSSGIGVEIAMQLGANGDHIALLARRPDRLQEVASRLPNATAHPVDLRERRGVQACIDGIVSEHGEIDVVVNNAGAAPERVLVELGLEEAGARFDQQLTANLEPTFNTCYAAAPHIARPGGRIINIGSVAAQTGGRRAGSAGYAAAKAAVHGLTLGLSRELAPDGVTVNTVHPGFIYPTEFTGGWGQEQIDGLVGDTPAGRPGTPADIAALVVFLASPKAAFITAQALAANGGMLPTR